jgi:hypothetical protein
LADEHDAIASALVRIANRLDALEAAAPAWPALMSRETLMAYLDCKSPSTFARVTRELKRRGYPGPDQSTHRHVREVIDRYLSPAPTEKEARRQRMLRAARGETS